MKINALSLESVKSLSKQKSTGEVCFIALDCYWGAPVSGRTDSDFFKLWATAKSNLQGKVFLQGGRFGTWDVNREMQKIDTVGQYDLYYLELGSIYDFPNEFVIRLDVNNGPSYYDNNDYCNYQIMPYAYRSVSAIDNGDVIFDLQQIHTTNLYAIQTKQLHQEFQI